MKFNEYTVGEIVSTVIDYRGKTPKKLGGDWSDNGYRALSAKNIKTGRIVQPETIRFVNAELYKKWMKEEIQKGDIIITSEAPFGQVYFWNSDEKIVLSQRLFAIRCNKEFYPNYIYQYMTTAAFQGELENRATGTTVMGLRQPELMKCLVYAPSFIEQKKIASILYALDDKIELNNKINENLEQQAQAIFKSWFVDFEPWGGVCPEDWEQGCLADIAEITMGQSPNGSSYNENKIGTAFFQGRAEFSFRFPTKRLYTTEPKRMAVKNDVLMSVRAPVGDVNVAHEDCCIGRGLAAIHSKNNCQSFVLYTMYALKEQLNVFNGEGTVFGSINKDALNKMSIYIPMVEVMKKFEETVSVIDAVILNNYDEIIRLQQLRDTLLPKLMSGEIDVSDIEI